jgi:hypothetical protein
MRAPAPITAVAASENQIFVASNGSIFAYSQDGILELLATIPDQSPITAMAYDRLSGAIFFTVERDLYLLKDGSVKPVGQKVGDRLAVNDGWLYVLDRSSETLGRGRLLTNQGFLQSWLGAVELVRSRVLRI